MGTSKKPNGKKRKRGRGRGEEEEADSARLAELGGWELVVRRGSAEEVCEMGEWAKGRSERERKGMAARLFGSRCVCQWIVGTSKKPNGKKRKRGRGRGEEEEADSARLAELGQPSRIRFFLLAAPTPSFPLLAVRFLARAHDDGNVGGFGGRRGLGLSPSLSLSLSGVTVH
jgi:hypothetical protein